MDKYVSGSILSHGVWEKNIVNLVLRALELYPAATFIDIGANIGIYTVLAAAAGRRVLAVDAVMENLAYISTSLNHSNTGHYVSLLNNPVRYCTIYCITVDLRLVTRWRFCIR